MPARNVYHLMTSDVNKRCDIMQNVRHSSVSTYIFVRQTR